MRMSIMALLLALVLAATASGQKMGGIEGVWSLTEVATTGTGGATKQATQPSLYIFTKKYYSIIYVSSDGPRAAVTDITKMSADDMKKTFVDSFVANAGTYEFKGGKLTVHPSVAKNPSYMEPGVFAVSSVKITGDSMTMTSESSNAGPSTNPTTYKLKRLE